MPQKFQQVMSRSLVVRYDPVVHAKVGLCGPVGPGWVVHVSLEVPLQRVQDQILVHNRVRVPVQSFGTHRMEVLSSVVPTGVPWVGH